MTKSDYITIADIIIELNINDYISPMVTHTISETFTKKLKQDNDKFDVVKFIEYIKERL